jgi:PadR family transcriptional regulator
MSSRLSTAPSIRRYIGWNARYVSARWEVAQDRRREFKYCRLTAAGQLAFEESRWKQLASAIAQVMWPAEEW